MIELLELFGGLKIFVFDTGAIKTLDHNSVRTNGCLDNRKGRFLKPKIDKYGYEIVTLSHNGIRKSYGVHRLVAMAFIPNPESKPTVNHKDGNKQNNNVDNLEWATQKEQKSHSISHGLCLNNVIALQQSNAKFKLDTIV